MVAGRPPDATLQRVGAMAGAAIVALGVLVFDWSAYLVLALYWIENVAIGVFHVARMLAAGVRAGNPGGAVLLSAFFCAHYGLSCLVHGLFVVAPFSGGDPGGGAGSGLPESACLLFGRVLAEPIGPIALAAIMATEGRCAARRCGRKARRRRARVELDHGRAVRAYRGVARRADRRGFPDAGARCARGRGSAAGRVQALARTARAAPSGSRCGRDGRERRMSRWIGRSMA
jgi:hypothetical protein